MKHKLLLSIGTLFAVLFCAAAEPAPVFQKKTREVLPAAARFRESAPLSWEILDGSGAKLGMLHQERIADNERQQGFGGTVEIAIVTRPDGKIAGVLVGKNQETPGFLNRVVNSGFLEKWNGMSLQDAAETTVDTVTSATYSSGAIAHGVKTLAADLADGPAPAAAKPGADQKALEAETARLERKIATSSLILSRGTLRLNQWQNRRAEELELREILALQGRDAAKKFADQHRMTLPARPPQKGSPVGAAAAAYRRSRQDSDLRELRAEIAKELDSRIAALLRQNAENAKAVLAAQQRLDDIAKELGRETPWSRFFRPKNGSKQKK